MVDKIREQIAKNEYVPTADEITVEVANDPVSIVDTYLIESYADKMHLAIQFTETDKEKKGWVKVHIKWTDSEQTQPVLVLRGALCLSRLGHIGNPCSMCGYDSINDAPETQTDEAP